MNNQSNKFNSSRLLLMFSSILFGLLAAGSASATTRNPVGDFDGDGKSDLAVFRPSNNYWYISKSSGGYLFIPWGRSGDTLMPGDYDGDGKTDFAVWRFGGFESSVTNRWYILRSSDFTFRKMEFGHGEGQTYSFPLPPADFDGDGKTDLVNFTRTNDGTQERRLTGVYLDVWQSSDNSRGGRDLTIGFSGVFVYADYDGDGKADFATFKDGLWTIEQSSNRAIRTVSFGLSNDILVPADYDGDGKVDIAVWRASNGYWYWLSSRDGSFNSYQFGQSGDAPLRGDYDGDGKTDFAVVRVEQGGYTWYIQESRDGFRAAQFGLSGDIAISNK